MTRVQPFEVGRAGNPWDQAAEKPQPSEISVSTPGGPGEAALGLGSHTRPRLRSRVPVPAPASTPSPSSRLTALGDIGLHALWACMEKTAALGVGIALGSQRPLPSRNLEGQVGLGRWPWGLSSTQGLGCVPGPCPSTSEHSLPLQQASRVTEVRPPPEGDPLPGWCGGGREWGDRRGEGY